MSWHQTNGKIDWASVFVTSNKKMVNIKLFNYLLGQQHNKSPNIKKSAMEQAGKAAYPTLMSCLDRLYGLYMHHLCSSACSINGVHCFRKMAKKHH